MVPSPIYALVRGATAVPPVLVSLNHSLVFKSGGSSVIITGTDLSGATLCSVSGTSATITGNTATTLTFTVPAKASGSYTVQVTTPGGVSNTLAIEYWSQADLSMSVLLLPSFVGVPWPGTASAGTSLNRDGVEPTNPPSVGTALNGWNPATFDGTNDFLTIEDTLTDIYGTGTNPYSGTCLINVTACSTNSGNFGSNDSVLVADGGSNRIGTFLTNAAGVYSANCYMYLSDGSTTTPPPSVTITLATWTLLNWRYDGTNLKIGKNAAFTSSIASLGQNASNSGFGLWTCKSTNSDQWTQASIMEIGCTKNSYVSDADLDKWRRCANSKYGLTL